MYEKFYGLSADPFRLSPDHRFCYQHPSYAKAKAYLEYALYRAEGFVMITGKPGTGKTTLINDVIEAVRSADMVIATLVSTQLEANDLLRMVAYCFGIDAEVPSKAGVLRRVMDFFERKHQEGSRMLLIIDEAQDLSPTALEELRLLTNLQRSNQPLLQIFLLGQEPLRALVGHPSMEQVQQRLVAAWNLEPLGLQETVGYVKHRLECVGWRNDPVIDEDVYSSIYQFSAGVPRRINLICSRLLLQGFVAESHRITRAEAATVFSELRGEELLPVGLASAPGTASAERETELGPEASAGEPGFDGKGWQRQAGAQHRDPEDTPAETSGPRVDVPDPPAASTRADAPSVPLVGESRAPGPEDAQRRDRTIPERGQEASAPPDEGVVTTQALSGGTGRPRSQRFLGTGLLMLALIVLMASLLMIRPALLEGHIADIEQWLFTPEDGPPGARHPAPGSGDARSADSTLSGPGGAAPGLGDLRRQVARDDSTGPSPAPPRSTAYQAIEEPIAALPRASSQVISTRVDAAPATDADRGAEAVSEAADVGISSAPPEDASEAFHEPTLPAEEQVEQSAGAPDPAPPPVEFGVDEEQARAQEDAARDADVVAQGAPEHPADGEADLAGVNEKPAAGGMTTSENPVLEAGGEVAASRRDDLGKVRFSDQVLFAIDSTRIRPRYREKLDQVAALVKASSSTVEIVGYADRLGPPAYNLDLSRRRAEAVADYLAGKGVSTDRLRAEGRGPRRSEYPGANGSRQANWQDRVVEVSVVLD